MFASAAHADENKSDNSVACVEIRIEKLNQSEAGKKLLESINRLTLGEECGNDHGWTLRKETAASFYAASNVQLQKERADWATTGLALDLPIRIKNRITLNQLSALVLQNKLEPFTSILAKELAVTGSKLNADDTIDKLSFAQSNAIGQKIGGHIFSLFMIEEFQKYFDNAAYASPELLTLFTAISPNSAAVLAGLK